MTPRDYRDLFQALSCNTSEYMATSKVMTLRIEPELLEELRDVANAEHRSVSAHVLSVLRRDLESKPPRPRAKPAPTLGWLRHLEAPNSVEEFRKVRRALGRHLTARVRRYERD
jgi:hypothetical protein